LLNTHLKRGITPPNKNSYPVYIPEDKLALFEEKYRPNGLQKYFVLHKIKSGETLSSLSKRYDVERGSIMEENMIGKADEFKTNRIVKIPMKNSFIKKDEYQATIKIPISASKQYNMSIDQSKLINQSNSFKIYDKEEH
jgi:membrane-bound lytic murein transglycosylase D